MTPSKIRLRKDDNLLELQYSDNSRFELSAELLRVYSPSAEVKGHGPGREVLQYGKRDVKLSTVERAGNYALRLIFDDSHDSGIYTWDYLYHLGKNREALWRQYLDKLNAAGRHRDPAVRVVRLMDPNRS